MKPLWIEFISAYCDRWCERCAFTERCSSFAVQSAIAMCDGDAKAALELTFGDPATPQGFLQSDWNGSAKVALLSIERSEAACRSVAAATKAEAAAVLAETLARLGAEVKKEFPRATEFRRPGFDR